MEPDGNRDERPSANLQVSRVIGDLVGPLTTIQGYSQLLQRRIRARGVPASDDLLAALARIEAAARVIDARLRQLGEELSTKDR
jgi:hypothetical protein